jgi:GNAT superfamily N-acetyltransferase
MWSIGLQRLMATIISVGGLSAQTCRTVPGIGAAHAIRSAENLQSAELAVAVLDAYHGRGLGRLLLTTVFIECERQGIFYGEVDILDGNRAALTLIALLGADKVAGVDGVAHFRIDIRHALDAIGARYLDRALSDVLKKRKAMRCGTHQGSAVLTAMKNNPFFNPPVEILC